LTELDGHAFLSDSWEKPKGETLQGNGITMIMEQGNVFERAGVGFLMSPDLSFPHQPLNTVPN